VFKSEHFDVPLKSISETSLAASPQKFLNPAVALAPELSLEELVRQAKPCRRLFERTSASPVQIFRHWQPA